VSLPVGACCSRVAALLAQVARLVGTVEVYSSHEARLVALLPAYLRITVQLSMWAASGCKGAPESRQVKHNVP
jgi:hypothetical protein